METQSGNGPRYLSEAIENYYKYNPDTLMPLLILSMAAQGLLRVAPSISSKDVAFAHIDIDEVLNYDWVQHNPKFKKRLLDAKKEKTNQINVVGHVPSALRFAYDTFYTYDTVTVVQEYHHKKGILVHHSENEACEKAQRQYATLCMAEEFIAAPNKWLQDTFLPIANHILELSGIQPKRPRIEVANTLCHLLSYDGDGLVYNPFAGCAFAGAMINAGDNLIADGDRNEKLLAVARLLCYGTGQYGCDIEKRDSTKWIQNKSPKYVISTFLGYVNGQSAFDFCLSHCLNSNDVFSRFAGIVAPKDIFENQSKEWAETLERDWIDTIVLLPFGEVAVLVNACKAKERKGNVKFYNLTNSILRRMPISCVLSKDIYAQTFKSSDIKKKHFLKAQVIPQIEPREGCELITLGDIYKKLPRRVWSLKTVKRGECVLSYIEDGAVYNEYERAWMQGIDKKQVTALFEPAYHLIERCLIVNSKGELEPRLYDPNFGTSYFTGAYAFCEKDGAIDYNWLIEELNQNYVRKQLHPYGEDIMLPESFTEDQVLSLKLNRPIEDEEKEDESDKLKSGFVLQGSNNVEYTIHKFLGNGNFGYAYSAGAYNHVTGEEKEVVLKEFFPHNEFHRENGMVVPDSESCEESYADDRLKFTKESELMQTLGSVPDSYIVPSIDYFECEETGTQYYVMPFFHSGSFDDFLDEGEKLSEELAIQHMVIPLCKALHTSQKFKVLHLDIKPENVLIDDNGDAFLTDFGTAKVYDNNDTITFRGGRTSGSPYAAPELQNGSLTKYDPRPDLFGIAGTIYTVVTRKYPKTLMELGQDEEDYVRHALSWNDCSDQFADAIVAGLQGSMNLRPKNAQEFLNLFPGCENIKL